VSLLSHIPLTRLGFADPPSPTRGEGRRSFVAGMSDPHRRTRPEDPTVSSAGAAYPTPDPSPQGGGRRDGSGSCAPSPLWGGKPAGKGGGGSLRSVSKEDRIARINRARTVSLSWLGENRQLTTEARHCPVYPGNPDFPSFAYASAFASVRIRLTIAINPFERCVDKCSRRPSLSKTAIASVSAISLAGRPE
jgi:hypothetical protein